MWFQTDLRITLHDLLILFGFVDLLILFGVVDLLILFGVVDLLILFGVVDLLILFGVVIWKYKAKQISWWSNTIVS